jgi:hypothetical protein
MLQIVLEPPVPSGSVLQRFWKVSWFIHFLRFSHTHSRPSLRLRLDLRCEILEHSLDHSLTFVSQDPSVSRLHLNHASERSSTTTNVVF